MWKKILLPLFEADKLVKGYEREQHRKRLCYITIIEIAGLILMGILNAVEHSYPVMYSTLFAAVMLSICLLIGWKKEEYCIFGNGISDFVYAPFYGIYYQRRK